MDRERRPMSTMCRSIAGRPICLCVVSSRMPSACPTRARCFARSAVASSCLTTIGREIEDGAIAGRGLEICWLKDQTDLLFAQIQGSARVRLQDGSTIRINYDSHNGYPYTAVGRILIDRGIIPKEQMSMQKIREWMEQNPDGANDVRRQNRAYVFFHEVPLSDKDEAVGRARRAADARAVDRGRQFASRLRHAIFHRR